MAPSDRELIDNARKGDMRAFEQLVYRYDKRVFGIAARFVTSSDDAKDIYQEVFLRVYNGLRRFESKSEFSTWLYRITMNVCLTYHSQRKHHSQWTGSGGLGNGDSEEGSGRIEAVSNDPSPEQHAADREVASRVEQALEILSPKQKMVFTLRHYQGYKLREIASMMKCTEGTVKRYLFSATQRMREQLADVLESYA
ncbi:MAG TPA: RNA polymerase sigma factor [Bacteroidota bacterium]|nr:RNA polymerase sigma factor [Bacteroidota bacterium]